MTLKPQDYNYIAFNSKNLHIQKSLILQRLVGDYNFKKLERSFLDWTDLADITYRNTTDITEEERKVLSPPKCTFPKLFTRLSFFSPAVHGGLKPRHVKSTLLWRNGDRRSTKLTLKILVILS